MNQMNFLSANLVGLMSFSILRTESSTMIQVSCSHVKNLKISLLKVLPKLLFLPHTLFWDMKCSVSGLSGSASFSEKMVKSENIATCLNLTIFKISTLSYAVVLYVEVKQTEKQTRNYL